MGDTHSHKVRMELFRSIDYIFNRYPKAKEVEELVSAAVKGFINGYRSVVTLNAGNVADSDEEAYQYLKSKMK